MAGQPCIDELEVYADECPDNLALASRGARATASSCLPGYAIHQVAHLNDGRYGNAHSWIAAGTADEWAQIELARPARIAKVVFSRDREGQYRDRMPRTVEVQLSQDGKQWETACRIEAEVPAPRAVVAYLPPAVLPERPTYEDLLRYAMLCERETWRRMAADDHLSPLQVDRPARPGGPMYWGRIARLDMFDRVLAQMDEMAERLSARGLDVAAERRQVADLRRRYDDLAGGDSGSDAADALYLQARIAKRQLMFRDPDLAPLRRILFVKRHPYLASHNYSDILDSQFRSGGGVCTLDIPYRGGRLVPADAQLVMLFDATDGIARDPVASYSANEILFAYRPGRSPQEGYDCYWHLMAMRADGQHVRQVTDGPFHDHSPCPLPDGGLAFISTRCKSRFLCWRPQAFVLFRMESDAGSIRPLSFANLSEWTPTVGRDGRILWTRSEYLDKGADFGHTLWAIHPDGTQPELIFGNNTPNCYMNGHEVPGTREICCTLVSHGGDHNGPIGLIDLSKRPSDPSAITNITPDVKPHYNMSWAQYECFRDPIPVSPDYFLVSHAPADRFGLYVIDRFGNRELLYLDPDIGSMRPTPLHPRTPPPVLEQARPESFPEATWAAAEVSGSISNDQPLGQFTVADVYQGLEPLVPRGAAKYLRVCQEVRADLEQRDNGEYRKDHGPVFTDFYATPIHKVSGPFGWPSYVAKASLGMVPIEADGSANFYAPAGKVLYFQLLDENLNELQRMRSVIQLQPGERRSCIGCHENRTMIAPAGLAGAFLPRGT
ncbi:MAG: discoidin domain-containing protein, partial [Planctomycetes bacterium]|nr:discoidin domain-containing protein [Planctomycetota bacterium]